MEEYVGKRIRLIEMYDDPDPIESGATGVVTEVVEFGGAFHLNVDWDPEVGRSLNLVCPPDEVEIIDEEDTRPYHEREVIWPDGDYGH